MMQRLNTRSVGEFSQNQYFRAEPFIQVLTKLARVLSNGGDDRVTEFDKVWNRVVAHEGQTFNTITGLPFQYRISGNSVFIVRKNKRIEVGLHKNSFAKAYELRADGPGELAYNLPSIFGPSYIWAILQDSRIK